MGVNPQRFLEVSDRFMVSETGPFFAHIVARLKYTLDAPGGYASNTRHLTSKGSTLTSMCPPAEGNSPSSKSLADL